MSIEFTVPWKKAGTDLLSWSGKDYLLSAHDRIIYRLLGIPQLNDTKATVVILFSKGTLQNMRNPVRLDQRQRSSLQYNSRRFCLNAIIIITLAPLDIQMQIERQSRVSKQPNKSWRNANEATLIPSYHC